MNEAILSRAAQMFLKERIDRAARAREARRATSFQKTKGTGTDSRTSKPPCRTTKQIAY